VQQVFHPTDRFASYRTFKAEFVGMPTSSPDLTTRASFNGRGEVSLTAYVSWNGATEVSAWEFFGADEIDGDSESLGRAQRTGFETSFISYRALKFTWVQAIDANGNVLGESQRVQTEALLETEHPPSAPSPQPHDVWKSRSPFSTFLGLSALAAAILLGLVGGFTAVGVLTVTRFLFKHFPRSHGARNGYTLIGRNSRADWLDGWS
jgi:hypothetical protein